MRLGILETLGLAGSLVFAIPAGLLGVERVLAGHALLGGGLLLVATLMVVLPQVLTTPSDIPAAVVERVVDVAVGDPDDET